jgi:hypothetical protein
MNSQSNQSPALNQADTSEAPMTADDRLAEVPARLRELLGRGEISPEEFALLHGDGRRRGGWTYLVGGPR